MSNQEDDITEIFGKLKTIFLRIRLGTKNKPRGFELNTRKIGTKMKKEWMEFKDKDEEEKFNESSLLKTEFHGVRGEMPGSSALATKNNNKGPF